MYILLQKGALGRGTAHHLYKFFSANMQINGCSVDLFIHSRQLLIVLVVREIFRDSQRKFSQLKII
jgi:hypothetical protein